MTSTTNFFSNDVEVLLARIENDTKALLSQKAKSTFAKNYDRITAMMEGYENCDSFDRLGLQVIWNIVPPKAQFCNNVPVATLGVRAMEPEVGVLLHNRPTAWPTVMCTDDYLLMTTATEKEAGVWATRMIDRCDEMLEWIAPFLRTQAFARAIGKVEPVEPTCLFFERGEKRDRSFPWACWTEDLGMPRGWLSLSGSRVEAVRQMYQQSIDLSLESLAMAVVSDVANGKARGVFKVTGFSACIAAGIAVTAEPSRLVIDFALHPRFLQDYCERYSVALDWTLVHQVTGVNYAALITFQSISECSAMRAIRLAAAHAETAMLPEEDTGEYSDVLASVADDAGLNW